MKLERKDRQKTGRKEKLGEGKEHLKERKGQGTSRKEGGWERGNKRRLVSGLML